MHGAAYNSILQDMPAGSLYRITATPRKVHAIFLRDTILIVRRYCQFLQSIVKGYVNFHATLPAEWVRWSRWKTMSLQYDDSMMYCAAHTSPCSASWTPVAWKSPGRTLSVSGTHVPATGNGVFMRGTGNMNCCPVEGVRLRAQHPVRPVQNSHAAGRNTGTPTRSLTTPGATYADAQNSRRDHP